MEDAVAVLRREVKAFSLRGLHQLHADLTFGRSYPQMLPGRRSWVCCPLSYRGGSRGSVDRDSQGCYSNAFTEAWDGNECDYLDEAVVLKVVKSELGRRKKGGRQRGKLVTQSQ